MTARKLQIHTGVATGEFALFVREFLRSPRPRADNTSPVLMLHDGQEVYLELQGAARLQGGGMLISGRLLRKLSTTDGSARFMKEQHFTLMMDGDTADANVALMS